MKATIRYAVALMLHWTIANIKEKVFIEKGNGLHTTRLFGQAQVIIPNSEIRWLLDQPDSVLSSAALHYDTLAGPYAFTDARILKDPFHEHVSAPQHG